MGEVIGNSQFDSCKLEYRDDKDEIEDSSDSCGDFEEALDDDLLEDDESEDEEASQ